MKLIVDKTKTMVISKERKIHRILIEGKTLEQVERSRGKPRQSN